MKIILVLLSFFFLASIYSCQGTSAYQVPLDVTDTFIKDLYNGDTIRAIQRIGVDPASLGQDKTLSKVHLVGAMRFLKENGLPSKSAYQIKEYPEKSMNLVDVIVPVKNNETAEPKGEILVRFVKFLPQEKIAYFLVNSKTSFRDPTRRTELDSVINSIK